MVERVFVRGLDKVHGEARKSGICYTVMSLNYLKWFRDRLCTMIETMTELLALREGNPPVIAGSPTCPVMRSLVQIMYTGKCVYAVFYLVVTNEVVSNILQVLPFVSNKWVLDLHVDILSPLGALLLPQVFIGKHFYPRQVTIALIRLD